MLHSGQRKLLLFIMKSRKIVARVCKLMAENNNTLWPVYKKHWHKSVDAESIVCQILDCAHLYSDTCAACRFSEPIGYNIKQLLNLKWTRYCMIGDCKCSGLGVCDDFQCHTHLRLWREYLGISRQQLAKKLGLAVNTVIQYELGNRNFKFDTAKRYAKALGLPPYTLVVDDGS